jgi:hypothetical protein
MSTSSYPSKQLSELKQQVDRIEHMLKFLIQERNLCLLTVPKNDIPEFKNNNAVLNELNTLLPSEPTKLKIQTPMVSPRKTSLLSETNFSHRNISNNTSKPSSTSKPTSIPPTEKFFEGDWKTKEEEEEFIKKHY